MKLYKDLKPDFEFRDERGILVQLVHSGYKQINILTSKKDVLRGEHFHKVSSEAFYIVSGAVEIILEKDNCKEKNIFKTNDFFLIYPNVIHSMKFIENTIMIAMYDIPIEDENGKKDIYTK